MGFFSTPNNYIGIDIGSTSIKIVELTKEKGKPKLVNYGFSENQDIAKADWQKDTDHTAKTLNGIIDKAKIQSREAVAALPTFSVFSSILNLANVNKKDLESAIHWEAKKVMPLPIEEMILDWRKVDAENAKKDDENVRVLITGAPKSLVQRYVEIFKKAQINLISLETETFSLVRSLVGNDKSTIMLVEIGASTTDVTIIDNSIPMLNRSIDLGGITITKAISNHLNIGMERADQFKYDMGIGSSENRDDVVPKTIIETISPLVNEIKYAMNLYQSKNDKKTEKIILSGGSSLLPSLTNYLEKVLNLKVVIGDPWSRVSYPLELESLLKEIGPRMSVAIGLAMREVK